VIVSDEFFTFSAKGYREQSETKQPKTGDGQREKAE
jgi:hypothetical protein